MVEAYLYAICFRVKLLEASGSQFQGLFGQIMRIIQPGFREVSAAPYRGDGGNDGWIEDEGAYYQVYAPEATTINPESYAQKKIIEDFQKLKTHWNDVVPVRKFYFVFNNRFKPASADLQKVMAQLKKEYKLEDARIFETSDLLDWFNHMEESAKIQIVGGIPSPNEEFERVLSPLGTLLQALAASSPDPLLFLTDIHPDFSNKIKINNLSEKIKARLELNSHLSSRIDEILKNSRGDAQGIVQRLKMIYNESKSVVPEDSDQASDMRYVYIRDKMIPSEVKKSVLVSYRAAAEIIIAKYFESCDIYESPGSVGTP